MQNTMHSQPTDELVRFKRNAYYGRLGKLNFTMEQHKMNNLTDQTDFQLAMIFKAAKVLEAEGYGGIPAFDQLVEDAKAEVLRRES